MSESRGNLVPLALIGPRRLLQAISSPFRVLGIDLGTTNSAVAEVVCAADGGQVPLARCLEVEQLTDTGVYTHVLVPSVVAIHEGQVWVGEGAKRLRANAALRRNKEIFYECKNDIGLRRTYHLAPEGFRSAAEVAAKVLSFLKAAADAASDLPVKRTVVTVPASFQVAQRRDTLRAAELAGLQLQPGDLLDEPVAAFLDYAITHRETLLPLLEEPRNLLVFDFGGGTCDVAVFRVHAAGGGLEVAPLAVSRYHRLGGGDIDTVIVHEELIPQLADQNDIDPNSLDFDQRKRHLEPALLSVAEALKIGLCLEIARLRSFGRYADADKTKISKVQPGVWRCPCPGYPSLALRAPRLTAARFEELLRPFLDPDFLYARETEYHLTCSIFAPLQDALDRAGVGRDEVDLCLMVGGSSLIPQVVEAVEGFLGRARLLTFEDRESNQVAVARGAAYHAMALEVLGRGLVQPVAHDSISLRVSSGLFELVPRSAPLPFPGPEQFEEYLGLVVPQTAVTGSIPLRVELVAGREARQVYVAIWHIPAPVNRGEPLRLRVQLDANQCLHLELTLRDQPGAEPFACSVENPVTLVVNPQSIRQQIEELEEDLRVGKVPHERVPETLRALADDYAELGQVDKAIYYLQQALRLKGRPDASLLNAMGVRYGQKRDWERQEKAYREAFRANPHWGGPLFNLALSQLERGQLEAAEGTIREALAVEDEPSYQVLLGVILHRQGQTAAAKAVLAEAIGRFGPVSALDDWQLGWFRLAAEKVPDPQRLEAAVAEQRRRRGPTEGTEPGGLLPEIAPALRRI
ncbi:MAG: hypothetical protein KatS3mg015_3126 [Fimbriimonadales bacterium]|nr:MAG: hypothetical protein KatS3mg015_3126 [Fimbriimonadales bacterium]